MFTSTSKRFFGPYQVLERIGDVAYKLDLPSTARIHNVFHLSLLRPHQGPLPSPQPLPLPPDIEDHQPILTPIAILDWKLSSDTDAPQQLVLIQWQGLPLEEATWEPWGQIKAQFHLEDKVNLEEEGDVRSTSTSRPIMVEQSSLENIQEGAEDDARPQRIRRRPVHLKDYENEIRTNSPVPQKASLFLTKGPNATVGRRGVFAFVYVIWDGTGRIYAATNVSLFRLPDMICDQK
ncbi:hypothetical protein VNO78_22876 [Psophocarpus tetragonolobus]|uniref:Tf2-1-like SH3-like domain-containing protein n=1 Tax=Psophocarpus tetragonolobus TaxID=3891 RepID=A0AAN9S354_PSOTE